MALSLIDLLELPPHERSESNINLNIRSLKAKCDMFYYLDEKEAFELLKYSELFRSSADMPLVVAQTNLCILFKGKVSLCQKTHATVEPTDESPSQDEVKEAEIEEKDSEKTKQEESESKDKEAKSDKKESLSPAARGQCIVQMVTALLDRRNTQLEEERAFQIAEKRRVSVARGVEIEEEPKEALILSKTALYGRPTVHYSEGAYFGGPDMPQKNNNNQTDQFTFVTDTPSLLLVIPTKLQSTIVNHHYLNLIRDKESLLGENHITKRLIMPQKSALLHEMLEEHFIHGNFLTKKGEPNAVVYLIKSGYARIYLDVKIPKMVLPEAVQHLPSTKLRQRNKTERLPIIDIGPGEFVGGFEHLCGSKDYMFTIVATCEIAAYSIRSAQFKDIILRANNRPLELLTNDMKTRWRMRRMLADFSLCPKTNEMLTTFLGENTDDKETEEAHAEIEALKSYLPTQRRSIPHYMMGQNIQVENSGVEERQSLRPSNRGPFADRVRNRMIELGFSSRRGI